MILNKDIPAILKEISLTGIKSNIQHMAGYSTRFTFSDKAALADYVVKVTRMTAVTIMQVAGISE